MQEPWQRQRIDFNHNWLKNAYLPALDRFLNLLRGEIEEDGSEKIFLEKGLRSWEEARGRAQDLCNRFEEEMSPRQLLREYPLELLDEDTKSWLGDLLHRIWLARFPVRNWAQDASMKIAAADAAYQKISLLLRENESQVTLPYLRPHADLFEDLREAAHQLARAIESFPRSILLL